MVVDPLIKFMKFSEVARSANEDALTSDLAQQRNLDSGTSSPLSSKLTLKESSRNQQPAYQSLYVSSATPYRNDFLNLGHYDTWMSELHQHLVLEYHDTLIYPILGLSTHQNSTKLSRSLDLSTCALQN